FARTGKIFWLHSENSRTAESNSNSRITRLRTRFISAIPTVTSWRLQRTTWISGALLLFVIPSEVENGAAGEAATWTGRPEAERTGSERIKSRGTTQGFTAGRLDFARHDNQKGARPTISPRNRDSSPAATEKRVVSASISGSWTSANYLVAEYRKSGKGN